LERIESSSMWRTRRH